MATNISALSTDFGFGLPPPWDDKRIELAASQSIVVPDAETNIAKIFIRLATRFLGITDIIAVASLSNADELKSLGISRVVDRHATEDSIIEQVRSAAGGVDKMTRIIDCASWDTQLGAATALAADSLVNVS